MPPRIARSSLPSGASTKSKGRAAGTRNSAKASKRALNAFAIAQFDNPEQTKIRKNRLGELDPSFHKKRARDDELGSDDEDEDGDGGALRKKAKRRDADESYDEGSDSEGNTWTMGHVDEDDDEDIDSDEAFGESDEERFEGFSFRGSSTQGKKLKVKKGKVVDEGRDVDMDESDEEAEGDDEFGDEGIDLATALDQYEEDEREEREEKKREKKQKGGYGSESEEPSEGEDVASDGASDLSSDDDEDEEDRQAQLKDLISSLATGGEDKSRGKRVEVHESAAPDEFGVSRKVDLLSMKPKAGDAEKKKALKLLSDDKNSKRNDIARKLEAPLPKRQQDKLDRAAANAKANETLDRWTDTIKQNRRAEHLSFPLQHKDSGKAMGEDRLLPTTTAVPANDLESTIQSILQQSGLSNGKDDEEQIQKWEILQTNKLPIEEVERRRAQLRMERELLFREEVRAKRIKKIKSKAYRRVHRKERERLLEKEREQLKADGVDLSEEEREHNDRRRAEERMGAKHREGKWAKGIKATGRAAWDQDALAGVSEMARRNEELRRRIEGKLVLDSDDEGSDVPSEENDSEDDSDADEEDLLQRQLGQLENPFSHKGSKLGQMAFMQKAEAAKRAENNEAIKSMRRDLAGEDSQDEVGENATRVGRRQYGPGKVALTAIPVKASEFEEHTSSDEEGEDAVTNGLSNGTRKNEKPKNPFSTGLSNGTRKTNESGNANSAAEHEADAPNPFLAKAAKAKKSKDTSADNDLLPFTDFASDDESAPAPSASKSSAPKETVDDFLQQRVTTADDDGWATVLGGQDSDDEHLSDEADDLDLAQLSRNHLLTAKGFAGDNVEADFKLEKEDITKDEASKETTDFLPGWGAWAGDGMSKRERRQNRGWKTTTQAAGIDANKRKDRKLERVIINEKTVKPNKKYLAGQLPFPFESREQYERSLRLPKGREWTTKKTHQDAVLPRVLVKGGVIAPMRKPLV
ncbi:Utp14-domain-containing protein [Didymella exigua CBS 183.55]|uniref:Utp14-domain-containing protein n=1 Tax=Didymella exigua CBS 183.55 TaxID=1150837 RepID=A0A6A5R6E7_9PLEO|nr:Utp14-domain-containing protein [Didymella exigua CBS 183.55]KAF1922959.1 Utp14-domain-containing protein [Didymella exigua CBS 183.55]